MESRSIPYTSIYRKTNPICQTFKSFRRKANLSEQTGAYPCPFPDLFCTAYHPAADTEGDGTGQTVCGKDRRSVEMSKRKTPPK